VVPQVPKVPKIPEFYFSGTQRKTYSQGLWVPGGPGEVPQYVRFQFRALRGCTPRLTLGEGWVGPKATSLRCPLGVGLGTSLGHPPCKLGLGDPRARLFCAYAFLPPLGRAQNCNSTYWSIFLNTPKKRDFRDFWYHGFPTYTKYLG
jgi:hypothetical protein